MATITTAADGNWSSTSSWSGGSLPGVGDTATINHQITLDISPSIASITTASTGSLVTPASGAVNKVAVGYPRPGWFVKPVQFAG